MKHIDLQREGKIRELRARGMGVRAIAREVGASASTVSRLLRGTVDHSALSELTSAHREFEEKLALHQQALNILRRALPAGSPANRELIEVFSRWPPTKTGR